jgi:SpoVK/Ycf46/Vps4 family AAA+-type ATPase
MNASLMKRLFRAMSSGNREDLNDVAQLIIDDEENKGHVQLAKELKSTLRTIPKQAPDAVFEYKPGALGILPRSRRHDTPLTTYIRQDQLEHEMILPPEVEARFTRIEKEYAARDRLALYGLQARRKILLYGPPGCGKTLGAQRLAWNTGLPLMKVRLNTLISSYLGETSSNLRSIFEASFQTPCVLFFDECDSIAQSRSLEQDVGEIKRVVNSFLQMLDEYEGPGLLVAATNLTEQLDPAVWRRFDDVFQLPKPGPKELKQLINSSLSAMSLDKLDWKQVLIEASGYSGAQIVRASRDAAKKVVLDGTELITQDALINSIREQHKGGSGLA